MAKSTTFAEYRESLDYDLQQKKEGSDAASAEKFRILPFAEMPRAINEVLRSLVRENTGMYAKEIIFSFYDSTEEEKQLRIGERLFVDINESVSSDGSLFTIPKTINQIMSFIIPNSYTAENQRDGLWITTADSSYSMGDIYATSKDTLYNKDGWTAGTEIRVKAVVYPDPLKLSIDNAAIFSATGNDNGVTFVFAAIGNFSVLERGDVVTVSGASNATWNRSYTVTSVQGNTVLALPVTTGIAGAFATGNLGFNTDNHIVGIDDGHIRLLTLLVKRRAYSRKGKGVSMEEYSELMREALPQYKNDKGRVNTVSKLNLGGASFGRDR